MADEFDCRKCGRHIVWLPFDIHGKRTCATCIAMPGWHLDPELRRRLDPDYAEERAKNPNLQTPKSGL